MSKQIEVDVLDIAKRITIQIHVKHTRQLQWRIKLACWLLTVANWVAGFGGIGFVTEVENEEAQKTQA